MSEKTVERKLVDGIKKLGGMCPKFVSPGTSGVPDRIVIMPHGKIIFAELKTETGQLSKIQMHTIDEMKKRGADVRVLYGMKDVTQLLNELNGSADTLRGGDEK